MSHSCTGKCTGCHGCAKELLLGEAELALLRTLGQIPFLPVARRAGDEIPVYLEDSDFPLEEYSLALQLLEKKGLISVDYGCPLSGADMGAYRDFPIHGSMALTARGLSVVDLLDKQGIRGE